jgi:hypothetical protein
MHERVIIEWWIVKDLEGRGCGLIVKYYPSIWREVWENDEIRVMKAGVCDEIWTRNLLNTKENQEVRSHLFWHHSVFIIATGIITEYIMTSEYGIKIT